MHLLQEWMTAVPPEWELKLLAQAPPAFLQLPPWIPNLLGAIAILIVGWIVAALVSSGIRNLLKRTDLDERLARMLTNEKTATNISAWIATIVFWVIMIVAIVAFLDALKLTTVSQPLNNFLNQIFAFLPRLGAAAVLVAIAWLVATLARMAVIRLAQSFNLDGRLSPPPPAAPPEATGIADDAAAAAPAPFLLSETLGNALYWFVFLFFLPLIMSVLELQGPLSPVQNLLNSFLAALPRIIEAVVIGLVGWFIARIVRGIVTNLLAAIGTDQLGTRLGLRRTSGGLALSGLLGTLVYVLILIPTAIAALDALNIAAISVPAASMLNQILNAIPQIFTAAVILVIAYVVGQFICELVSDILTSLGFNGIFDYLGFSVTPVDPSVPSPVQPRRTPSQIAGIVAFVGVMLLATVAATNVLNIPALTAIVSGLIVVFGRVLVGVVVFAVGLYLANLVFGLISSSGGRQARILGQAARIAVLALTGAMALQQMGIASDIVNLAFGLLLGAIAVAIALAFGLGGRDVAAEQLRAWLTSFKERS